MREYSYTLLVDDLKQAEIFYEDRLGWNMGLKNDHYALIEPGANLKFGIVEKNYILNLLKMNAIKKGSFVSWLYKNRNELNEDKISMLHNGAKEMETKTGCFLTDSLNNIWELRVEGEII